MGVGLRRFILWTMVLVAVAALAAPKLMKSAGGDRGGGREGAGAASKASGGGRGAGDTAASKAPPPAVRVHLVAPERMAETLVSPGTLVANERIEVVSESAGLVQKIYLDEGARVDAGDLLVKIDDRE